ncbi:MAG: class I SAM-dependent methyltransferase [Candidatus Levybacteria bacterium]|nr:class I SAM-dependent methyltransferase [Candidatus Levybacteria bacterium]
MKNIIGDKPNLPLHGRLLEAVSFVDKKDIYNKRVLDIGCGYGWYEVDALKKNPKKIYATEISAEDLSTIKTNLKNSKITYGIASAIDLPFKKNSIDTVVSWEVIEHIPENSEATMFTEVSSVLKKNGAFYLSTPNRHILSILFDPGWWLINHRHYSSSQLINFGKKNNLKLEKIQIKGGKWELIGLLLMYFSKWVLRRKTLLVKALNKRLDKEYGSNGFMTIFIKYKKV